GGQPADDKSRERGRKEKDHSGCDRHKRCSESSDPAHTTRQHKLGSAGILLGAKRPHRPQEAEESGEDGEGAADAPGGIAANRDEVIGLAVKKFHGLVVGEAVGEAQTVGERGIGVPITDRLKGGERGEYASKSECAGPGVTQGSARQRREWSSARRRAGTTSGRDGRRHGRSGVGRSPRATARGS